MRTIKDFLQLDIKKIEEPDLKQQVQNLIKEHKMAEDKEFYIEQLQSSMDTIYELVEEDYPEAITSKQEESPCGDAEESETVREKNKKTDKDKKFDNKKEKPKSTKADILPMNPKLQKCDADLKAYRAERRKLLPQKPPTTRYMKIKNHIMSLGNLIPPKLKDDLESQKETKKILMKAHRDLLKSFKMTSLRNVKRDQNEIKEKYEKIEEKLEK